MLRAKGTIMAGKQALGHLGSTRGQSIVHVDPDRVILIGLDTPHRSRADHWAWQQRATYAPEEDIVVGMMHVGVQQAVFAWRDGDDYLIFDGRQRTINLREANRRLFKLGQEKLTLPVVVKTVAEAKAAMLSVILNEHRVEKTPFERAEEASDLISKGFPMDRVAGAFRVDEQTINAWLSMLSCHKRVKAALEANLIGVTSCVRLAKLSQDEQVVALDELLASGDTSIKAAEHAVATQRARKAGVEAPYQLPSKSHLKRIIKLRDTDDVDAVQLPDEFVMALRWITGDLAPRSIKGLSACMASFERTLATQEGDATSSESSESGAAFDHGDKPADSPAKKSKSKPKKKRGKWKVR